MKEKDSGKKNDLLPKNKRDDLMLFDNLDQLFDEFLTRRWPSFFEWHLPTSHLLENSFPKIDMIDHDNELEVQAALPGVNKDDLDVSISNQSITIRTASQKETQKEGKYFRREISRGEFRRTLNLPDSVDVEKASATFKDGLLKVILPKVENAKMIKVQIQ